MLCKKLQVLVYSVAFLGFSASVFADCPPTISYEDGQKLASGAFITVGNQRFHPEEVSALPTSSFRILTKAIFSPVLKEAKKDTWKGDVCTYTFSTAKGTVTGDQKSFTIRSAK
ncbi:MAG: hypothetical protein Q8S31_01465 [Alphaproteobacteria bacterium]|nr:hypothetical protein [Alphaproteobacteria bacterium]